MTAGLPLDGWPTGRSSLAVDPVPGNVLLDLKQHCCPREAVAGYASALTSLGIRFHRAESLLSSRCTALIVPAALEIPTATVRAIMTSLEAGASVILESGAGFANGPEFRAHRALLRDVFQIHVEPPVQLWPAQDRSRGIPYVDYTWPHAMRCRDFSRVVPLGSQAGEIIARIDGLPVALKRPHGRGILIFLGSPIGPALRAGDPEGRGWLRAVLAGPRDQNSSLFRYS